MFINEDFDRAKEFFLEAIGVEADCIEAIYNLGLVYKRLGYYNESLQAFEKLHTIIPNSYEVIYQIAHVYELIGMRRQALKWYNILITKVPSDSEILASFTAQTGSKPVPEARPSDRKQDCATSSSELCPNHLVLGGRLGNELIRPQITQ